MSKIYYLGRFIRFMMKRFIEDRGTHTAGTLAYTTLISLVPLLAVGLSFLAIFADLKNHSNEILDFLFVNFVPASKEILQEHIQEFAGKATKMSAAGLVVLIFTALMMMATIDASLNRIWRVRTHRNKKASFLVYGAVLTWGPILVGAGIGVTSYLVSLPLVSEAASPFGGKKAILGLTPYVLETAAFVLLYLIVPNRRIRFSHALAGGILAAVLFEAAKRGFAWYVTTFPTYEAIYGALAVIPIFLVWVYVSWLVILLGAEFACCLDVYRDHNEMDWNADEVKFVLAVRLLGSMWKAQHQGSALTVRDMLKAMPTVDEENLRDVLLDLKQAGFIARTTERRWMLALDMDDVTLLSLYRSGNFNLPEPRGRWTELDGWSQRLAEVLVDIDRQIDDDMDISLKSLFRSAPADSEFLGQAQQGQEQSNVHALVQDDSLVGHDDLADEDITEEFR
ncbi:MAG: virulence factor BrkB family protein [Gammaproteobacteria bacterium]|nr:virulence factor BrkB family protein [Gammaproteobacteria bacterium]